MAGLLVIEVPMGFLQQVLAQIAAPYELHHEEEGVLGPGSLWIWDPKTSNHGGEEAYFGTVWVPLKGSYLRSHEPPQR